MRIYHLIIFLLISNSSFASVEFEKQYTKLIEELRCMVCQNQNLAESEAPLAVDMKEKIREMLEAGKTEKEIKSFLSERYSSYILYDPPVNMQNILLWLGPFIFILFLGYFLLRRYIKWFIFSSLQSSSYIYLFSSRVGVLMDNLRVESCIYSLSYFYR